MLRADVRANREAVVEAAATQIATRAKRAGLMCEDLTAAQFQLGIAAIARPLPEAAVPNLTQRQTWLVGVYLRGLRPRSGGFCAGRSTVGRWRSG